MPVQTSPPSFPDSFPSFMSVYGAFPPRYKEDEHTIHPLQVPAHVPVNTNSSRRFFPSVHRASVSSMTSGSTESSPTTTISPFDSPSTGDVSPSSSPETPSAMPLSYPKFTPHIRPVEMAPLSTMTADSSRLLPAPNTARPDSPGRRARNLKNLSLRMPLPSQSRPPIATASMLETSSKHHLSAPPSPIQIPPKSSRRRPANLTIRTPGFDKSFTNVPDLVPPTPLGRQSLRHAESSPSLASITSPGFAPRGGMQLPRPTSHHGTRRPSATSSDDAVSPLTSMPDDGSTFSQRVIPELAEEDEPMGSRESTRGTERGYLNGPIRIYDTGVFLYLEPTAEEAAQFDVVINVAKEVKNPFNGNKDGRNDTVMSTWRNASKASKRFSGGDPQTAISEISFKSAFEYQPSESGSATPTTPTPKSTTPEYVHVGWDHNSEILDDLLPLCELIDDRISQGKKVLIHCQLGASRSASLVIAYGLYKNRNLDFNSMYELVKGRSQWVGPNMSLIYQLTDYRSRLLRGSPSSRPAPREWFVQTGRRSSEPQVTRAEREEAQQQAAEALSQAPLMGYLAAPPTKSLRPQTSGNGNRSPKRSLSPRPLPFRQKFQSVEPEFGRPRGIPRSVSSCDPLVQTHVFVRDAPGSPDPGAGFFSPRTSGFLAPPLPLPSLSARGVDSTIAENSSSIQYAKDTADPRSPPAGGDRMILRNIDEFL
ncbi:protein-tyrosine phosphatase [Penicillium brasilianum]|uniref:protein-tyrosine-phosphatase n=1 Tax=Penicillium brasilianum TaxID=104259 RepID=A0A1S9RC24_PENBI|nr:protein-tyrosine phosphatase [Penicillium brasilianum]